MKILKRIINSPLLHPLLFGIFPITSLWAYNFDRMHSYEVVLPLTFSLVSIFLLYLIMRLISRSWLKAGLFTSLMVLLYFTYGHVYNLVEGLTVFGVQLGRHRLLILLWLAIFIAGAYLIARYGKKAASLSQFLNSFGLILIILTVVQLLSAQYTQSPANQKPNPAVVYDKDPTFSAGITDKTKLPDIYLVILDAYAREDVLAQQLNYDNQPFIKSLTELGFVVPKCSMPNYVYTVLAMSSELNMSYLEPLAQNGTLNYTILGNDIKHSLVRAKLSNLGYKTISFESEFTWVEIPDADIYYTANSPTELIKNILGDTEFDAMLNDTSAWKIVDEAGSIFPPLKNQADSLNATITKVKTGLQKSIEGTHSIKYDVIMNSLDKMENIADVPGPKFVYLHLSSPHPDFVIGPNGEAVPDFKSFNPGYPNAITYLNKRFEEIFGKIIRNSKVPPVIIVQGDHGYGASPDTRSRNFVAYYFPGAGAKLIYPSVTSVNAFRMVFNAYFGSQYPMLADISNFSTSKHLFTYQIIPPNCAP